MTPQQEADRLKSLVTRCELSEGGDRGLDRDLCALVNPHAADLTSSHLPHYTRCIDAALTLLPEGADWRRLTPRSISAYAANPYNAAAQKRHDGYGSTVALQMCGAALRVRLEPILKKLAIEARKAAA